MSASGDRAPAHGGGRSPGLAVGGAVAAIAVLAFVAWKVKQHGDEPVATTTTTTTPPSTPHAIPAEAPRTPTPTPTLPDLAATPTPPVLPPPPSIGAGSDATTPADGFATETRDPAWAGKLEAEIAQRLKAVPAQLTTECRSARCKLTLEGDATSVSKTIAALETSRGLVDLAASIYLTKPIQHDDGTLELAAFATFTR